MASDSRVPTQYLSAGRTAPAVLADEIARAASSPVVEAVLRASAVALAVVDANRQLVALNVKYVDLAGAEDASTVLGMRPGEALSCIHAATAPGGCGTCLACASCGAAVALLGATVRNRIAERDCFLASSRDGVQQERAFRVRAVPFPVQGEPFVLMCFIDVSEGRRREALDRVFLHDLANVAAGLQGLAEGFADSPWHQTKEDVQALAEVLAQEVRLQRALMHDEPGAFDPRLAPLEARLLVEEALAVVAHHSAAAATRIEVEVPEPSPVLQTDGILVQHVVVNMILNALEASRPDDPVRVVVRRDGEQVSVRVWNRAAVPEVVRPRIFQRFYTTKGHGRGLGTYSMKLFGETYLGGRVAFTSSAAEGTWFELLLRGDGRRMA